MKQSSLTRRLFAGVLGLMVGTAGAVALATPASATGGQQQPFPSKNVEVAGAAECDPETGDTLVTWTVTNTSPHFQATVSNVSSEVAGVTVDPVTVVPASESVTGTQVILNGTTSATLEVELTWSWQWGRHGAWKSVAKTGTATVEWESCKDADPDPDPDPEPEPVIDPLGLTFVTCDLLAFIIDNTEGTGEAVVTFTPNETTTHGVASGFSYTIDEEGTIEIFEDEDAGISENLGEADGDNPVVLTFAPGDGTHVHAFEASESLVIGIELTVDGEPRELALTEASWAEGIAETGLDCAGEGGELPKTGVSTGLIALGALALLALGGGLFLVARRRRVTFTA